MFGCLQHLGSAETLVDDRDENLFFATAVCSWFVGLEVHQR